MVKKKMTLEEKLEEAIVKDLFYTVPENWVNTKLNSIVKFEKGKKPKILIDNYKNNAIPYVTIKYFQTTEADKYTFETETNRICNKDDILIVWDGARAGLIGTGAQGALGSTLCNIKFNYINKKFMYYYFVSKYDFINSNTKGTGIPHVDPTYLDTLVFSIPPLKEQQRIVDKIESLFEKLDKAKELIEEARDDFEKRKSSILEKAFRGELTKEWRNINSKYNAFTELESIKKNNDRKYQMIENSNVKFEIPKSWIWTNLGELIDLLSDYHSNGSYKVLKEKVELLDEPDYACMIRTTNFEKDNFTDLMKYITKDAYEHLSKSKLFGEEILINKIGNAGSVYFMPTLGIPASLAMNLFMLRISNYVSSKYIYYHLKSIYSTGDINQFVRGITTKTIDKKSINSLNIALPPLEEQKEIVKILDKLLEDESKIEELTKLEEQIELIKKSILAKAFRGQLGTNCEDDESALELLKDILSNQ